MKLNEIEEQLLLDLYDRDIKNNHNIKIVIQRYNLEETTDGDKLKELVYYIEKLERFGYVTIKKNNKGEFYLSGGIMHPKYNNNALMIEDHKIKITELGINYVEQLTKTKTEKIKESLKNFFKDAGKEVSKEIIKYIVIFILGVILGKLI